MLTVSNSIHVAMRKASIAPRIRCVAFAQVFAVETFCGENPPNLLTWTVTELTLIIIHITASLTGRVEDDAIHFHE